MHIIYFGAPYPDETLFSYHGRLRVYLALVSPKALMEYVYDKRTTSVSAVFPANIKYLTKKLSLREPLGEKHVIYQHTLFSLFAPFKPPEVRQACEKKMLSADGKGVHIQSGYVASRLPKLNYLRYCPQCRASQINDLGEAFWQRVHQVVGITTCPEHGSPLIEEKSFPKNKYRHDVLPAQFVSTTSTEVEIEEPTEKVLGQHIKVLLNYQRETSATFKQWTEYYKRLALSLGFNKGRYVDYQAIKKEVTSYWSASFLARYNLCVTDNQTNWLHSIFRKHRKSFSFLEHLVVNIALLKDSFDVQHWLDSVMLIEYEENSTDLKTKNNAVISDGISGLRQKWQSLVEKHGAKVSRDKQPALYMQLYRQDKEWLININSKYKRPINNETYRVNWRLRDFQTTKALFRILYGTKGDLTLPFQSRRWFMLQLNSPSTIEKYIEKLPLTNAFLSRYAETVDEYQIRRVTRELALNKHRNIYQKWYLLRAAGLSTERMTGLTQRFIDGLSIDENLGLARIC